MIEECIVHVGMNKTGSSSIQETLSRVPMKGTQYLNLGPSNHSGVFATLFGDNPETYHGNVKHGRTRSDVYELRTKFQQRLSKELNEAKLKRVMVSAEDLSFPNDREKLERLRDFLSPHCSAIKVIGYVRPPSAFIHSAFQQRVKGGMGHFNIRGCYPSYRSRFEQIDQVFGRENVTLRKFSSDALYFGDVVKDIFEYLGESVADEDIVRDNDSISVEALSVLYLYRKFGAEYGSYKSAPMDNQRLISFFADFGSTKLKFSESIMAPIIDSQSEDLMWMEQRLGVGLDDGFGAKTSSEFIISSEKDLIDLGNITVLNNVERVCDALRSMNDFDSSTSVAVLDMLKMLTRRHGSNE